MSSPPPYQSSSNPLKRPSISSSASQPLGKKQRMHPLRQTSFPTGVDAGDRSFAGTSEAGSVTGSFTGSLGGASADGVFSGAARGKKRGRKSKVEKERERERDDALSARGGDSTRFGSVDNEGSVRGGPSGGGGGGGGADDADDYDEEDEAELFGQQEGTTDTEAEKKNLAILVDAFNPMQSERYDLFKRAKLRKETLRRIVNHALSQSVPASVVTTVNGFTKVFAGEVIEMARTVQAQWAEAHDLAARDAFEAEEAAAEAAAQAKVSGVTANSKPSTPTPAGTPVPGSASASFSNGVKKEPHDSNSTPTPSIPTHQNSATSSPRPTPTPLRPRREFRPPPNPHRGQLLPSHLREAVRRTKRNGEGGGVGYSGLSLENLGGLRGIASFLVVLTHLARAWDYALFSPRDNENASPRILQWPILRIPWQGRLGVTIFAFLTGYVCALKPLKLSRAGDTTGAFKTIAKSAFRRPPRLIFPATIALFISWTVAQFGGFIVANRSDCWWCRYAAPDLADSFWKELIRLPMNFLSTWTTGYMAYDDHQWALLPLLLSSMLVYLVLFATMFVKFRYRVLVYIGLLLYFHQNAAKDIETFQMQAIYGMLLSDFSYDTALKDCIEKHPRGRKFLTISLTIIGLLIASYPGEHPEWAGWSNVMLKASQYIFPPEVNVGKRYTALGIDMIILAIFFSPSTKDFLSSRLLLWLGKQSFAVYLVHGTMLRVVLCWMLYGISGQPWEGPEPLTDDERDDWLPIRPPWVVAISIPIWIGLVYLLAALWTTYVDTFCASMTQKLERAVFVEEEKTPLPLQSVPMQTT
ncbi:hypothetical protein PENFLA_c012G02838 [Penicillium flavigenum]|uniref:TAFII28-like protein domain-containing protein n=1 Tax=Penicillium flavigenum TaxID=254877 RepID=A0A1V6T8X7_9EURO|nr:hypothetical protein PENFLA_c012G02838 [Penicillium flavigenum]